MEVADAKRARRLVREVRDRLDQLEALLGADRKGEVRARPTTPTALVAELHPDTPMRIDDINTDIVAAVIGELPEIFDTYHVVEHPMFQAAHQPWLDRPAINQLTGKVLRTRAVLNIEHLDQRGRRRSARWRRRGETS